MSQVEILKLKEGVGPILFAVHASGGTLAFGKLSRHLGPDQPFYLLKGDGIDSLTHSFKDLYDLASKYAETIVKAQPGGPFMICGRHSATVVEVARTLLEREAAMPLVIIFDSKPPTSKPQQTTGRTIRTGYRDLRRFGSRLSLPVRRLFQANSTNPAPGKGSKASGKPVLDPYLMNVFRRWLPISEEGAPRPGRVNRNLTYGYVARPYPGRIVFIQSVEFRQDYRKSDYADRWATAADSVVFHTTPGGHRSMYDKPYVQVLGNLVQRECDAVLSS